MKKNKKFNILSRILCVLLLVCAAMPLFALQTLAAQDAGNGIEWSIEGDKLIISGNGEMRDFTENDTPPWHKHRHDIRVIIVKDGVESVGDLAFYQYSNVVSVELAKSVKSIGAYAFSDCEALEMISLSGVEHIGKSAFARCTSLTSIRLPKTVKTIEDKAFYRCTGLESVYIPESVSSLGNMIFTYCDNLIGASVQASVNSIPEWMFYGCENLAEVVLGEDIKTAEDQAFYGCESFTSLYYPSGSENNLVESIKSTSIETFSDQNLRSDTPTNNELEGANATIEGTLITRTDTTLSEGKGSIISVDVTTKTEFKEGEFERLSASVAIEALVDSDAGWDELLSKIQSILGAEDYTGSTLYVLVKQQTGQSVPERVLKELKGQKVRLDIRLPDGSLFGVDCEKLTSKSQINDQHSLGCTVTKDPELAQKHNEVLDGADTYKVNYDNDINVNFSNGIFVGKENANKVATIYVEKPDGTLERVQSAVIDKNGNATFYIQSVSADTQIVLGVNVKGETIENAIIPDSMAIENYDLIERYRPIEYAPTEERIFLGLNSWQYALAVLGVMAGIVIVVSIIAVIIYRKKRLELMHQMQRMPRGAK